MKHLTFKLALFPGVVTLLIISYFTQAEINNSANNVNAAIRDTQYHIGAFDNGWYSQYNYLKDSLKFNIWHNYSALENGWQMDSSDNYLEPIPAWISNIVQTNKTEGMRTYMDRPIIQYIVAGQRIDYECEQIPSNDPYWFYAFSGSINGSININDIVDNDPRHGSGEKVKKCKIIGQDPITNNVLIDSGIISDRDLSFNATNDWMKDNYWKWYIMPRIRIDSVYASGSRHDTETVCIIQITGWHGQVVKNVPIRVQNFKSDPFNPIYNGNYLDTFYFRTGQENLIIGKSLLRNFIDTTDQYFFAFDWNKHSGNDIKIYWTGKCDMWIDRVRLENDPAHQYLTLRKQEWTDRLNSEIYLAKTNQIDGIPNYFYFEECEFSHFPAIKELNKQITESTDYTNKLIIWLNYDLFRAHMPGFPYSSKSLPDAVMLKKYMHDDFGLNTIVMGAYALEGYSNFDVEHNYYWSKSYHPNTLFDYTQNYDSSKGILSYGSTIEFYDNWLQTHLDTGRGGSKLIYINKLMDGFSKNCDMRIINCPQAHLWYSGGHKLKEPTNEELELQTCLGITYNAKGTMFFTYTSSLNPFSASFYSKGIMERITREYTNPRDTSVYKQNKFKKIGEINNKLQKWGPYIMSFDPSFTNSCIYRLQDERTEFLDSTYFADIITYKPGTEIPGCSQENPGGNPPAGLMYECNKDRYLQAATFKTEIPGASKYFMIVNRRCAPFIDESTIEKRGGKRYVRVRIDTNHPDLNGYDVWEIIDLETGLNAATFNKTKSTVIDLGWYLPGEGKLYKLTPF